jgi:hypothetical protein
MRWEDYLLLSSFLFIVWSYPVRSDPSTLCCGGHDVSCIKYLPSYFHVALLFSYRR